MRRRTFTLLLLPILVLLWTIGWTLYWMGKQQSPRKPVSKEEPEQVQAIVELAQEQEIPQ